MNRIAPLSIGITWLLAGGTFSDAAESANRSISKQVLSVDELPKHIHDSEIVLIGLVQSLDVPQDAKDPKSLSIPANKLHDQFEAILELGGKPIPNSETPTLFSEQISLLVVESNKDKQGEGQEIHQDVARQIYEMLGAPGYVMSDPVIFFVHKGKLVRCYGNYQEPGPKGMLISELAFKLLTPDVPEEPLLPEISMTRALEIREKESNKAALEYLRAEFAKTLNTRLSYRAFSYFWTEAQVRSGSRDAVWASMVYDMMFTVCQENGYYGRSMDVVANLCSTLLGCGRYGRFAEIMAIWEKGQQLAGNKMNLSAYRDLGPAIPCLPEIRLREMPATTPAERPTSLAQSTMGFSVNDAGAFHDYSSLLHASGRWQEALEYIVWIRNWATDQVKMEPIGERASTWYAAQSTIMSYLDSMGFHEEALSMAEVGLAAPHGWTYHGRWKIYLAADHLDILMQLDRLPADGIEQFQALVTKARRNGHIHKGGVWSIQIKLARALIKAGRTSEGETLLAQLISDGSLSARRARLDHWVKSGRTKGVEDELKDLLRFSREAGRKMDEYTLYKHYADFLESAGRHREALLMRREVIRLAKSFRLFTDLPVEQSKLAVLLMRLGDPSGSQELAEAAQDQIRGGRLPKSIIAEIHAILTKLENLNKLAKDGEKPNVDLQPRRSIVMPIADMPWITYLTLTNPGKETIKGNIRITGPSAVFSEDVASDDIKITLTGSHADTAESTFICSVEPGTYRLLHLTAAANTRMEGEVEILWKDDQAASNATITLEAPESGVNGAIIQAGDYRANPFYGVPLFLQYVSKEEASNTPPLRFKCSQPSRVEIYQLDGDPLAIDAQGNGSLLNQGDELFVTSDGEGNPVLPLTNGNAAINLMLYPQKAIPDEGLTIDIEAKIDGTWQLYSRNRLAK